MTDPSRMTNLNRAQMRKMGLTTSGLIELYEQAQTHTRLEGCTCGVERITPRPTRQREHKYHVEVYHGVDCPLHPANVELAEREAARRAARPLSRLRRAVTRR